MKNSNSQTFVILGAGGHARVVAHILEQQERKIIGYIAPEKSESFPYQYIGDDDFLFSADRCRQSCLAIGIGITKPNRSRGQLIDKLISEAFDLPPLISANAIVDSGVEISAGAVVLGGAVLVVGSRIGAGSIINHHATVDHDCVIQENTHIAPGATLCGNVRVNADSLVGAGSTIIQGITIAHGCAIGAGATIVRDTKPGLLYTGCPGKARNSESTH